MLHSISWAAFSKAALTLALIYYMAIAALFYQKEIKSWLRHACKAITIWAFIIGACDSRLHAQTADGNNGINQANTMVRSYFDTGTQLLYAVGAIVGLIGAFRVFSLMQHDHRQEANKAMVQWFGSCIFLVIVATVIKSFFGL